MLVPIIVATSALPIAVVIMLAIARAFIITAYITPHPSLPNPKRMPLLLFMLLPLLSSMLFMLFMLSLMKLMTLLMLMLLRLRSLHL